MGVSTDAVLVYGYVWKDEDTELFEDDDREWDEILLTRRGMQSPWDAFPEGLESLPYAEQNAAAGRWKAEHRADLDAWYAAKKAIRAEYGVEIDQYCSGECSIPIIKIEGAGYTVARGDVQELTAADLTIDPEWDRKLSKFAEDLEIDLSEAQGPGWFLASWWG